MYYYLVVPSDIWRLWFSSNPGPESRVHQESRYVLSPRRLRRYSCWFHSFSGIYKFQRAATCSPTTSESVTSRLIAHMGLTEILPSVQRVLRKYAANNGSNGTGTNRYRLLNREQIITKVAPRLANLRNLANFARSGWHLITLGNAWKDLIGLSGLIRACQDSPGLARRVKIVTQHKIQVYRLSCTLIRAHQFSPDASYSIRYCQQSIIHIRSSSIFIVFVNKI